MRIASPSLVLLIVYATMSTRLADERRHRRNRGPDFTRRGEGASRRGASHEHVGAQVCRPVDRRPHHRRESVGTLTRSASLATRRRTREPTHPVRSERPSGGRSESTWQTRTVPGTRLYETTDFGNPGARRLGRLRGSCRPESRHRRCREDCLTDHSASITNCRLWTAVQLVQLFIQMVTLLPAGGPRAISLHARSWSLTNRTREFAQEPLGGGHTRLSGSMNAQTPLRLGSDDSPTSLVRNL
jgi:hypothetical protein